MDPGKQLSLEELKSWNKDLVNSIRDEKILNGFTDQNGVLWDTSPTSLSNLNGVCTLIALGAVTTDQIWRDSNNVNHTLTPQQLVELAGGLALFIKTCYGVSWYHKENINNISDEQSLLEYDINTNWP